MKMEDGDQIKILETFIFVNSGFSFGTGKINQAPKKTQDFLGTTPQFAGGGIIQQFS